MGKEADCDARAARPGYDVNRKLGHMGVMSAPRTPLRVLIAQESGLLWTSEPTDLKPPARKRPGSGRLSPQARRNGTVGKAGSPSPPSGSSSPKTFATRLGQVSHKIRVFKKAGTAVQPIPQAAERPVQLGALFAQEREEARRAAVEPHMQPLRNLIAADSWAGMRVDGPLGRTLRSPSPRNVDSTKLVADTDESQEIRYLFAKDWALQTSDEEDEFWDSGPLCEAPMPSRPCDEQPRRRSRFYKNEKLSSSSHCTSEPELEIVEVRELHVQSLGRGSCRLSGEDVSCGGSKSSLGTLLAEEIATSSGSPLADPRWSVPAAESSRRAKIGSLSDISAPMRPESQSQLDFLIAKILTLRANSVTTSLPREGDGGCSASESSQTLVGEESNQTLLICAADATDTATASDADLSIEDAPDILPMNPPSTEIREAASASTQEAPTLTSTSTTSTGVDAPITASDAIGAEDGEEAATSRSEDVEATPRVQLGTLLERTWGEHGWLPLSRSQMNSPLPATSQPSSSSTSKLTCESPPREAASEPSPSRSPERALPPQAEDVEAMETVREADTTPARERPPARVSLLSLLNQDMETDEDGLQADACGFEEDEVVTEELDPMCCVCMVGHKGAAFIPCGHTFCRKCCREVRRSIGSCPLCNQAIVDVLNLY